MKNLKRKKKPGKETKTVRVAFRCTPEERDYARKVGLGNLSRGVRVALDYLRDQV